MNSILPVKTMQDNKEIYILTDCSEIRDVAYMDINEAFEAHNKVSIETHDNWQWAKLEVNDYESLKEVIGSSFTYPKYHIGQWVELQESTIGCISGMYWDIRWQYDIYLLDKKEKDSIFRINKDFRLTVDVDEREIKGGKIDV